MDASALDEQSQGRLTLDNPRKLNYASCGVGSTSHVAGELFKTMAGLEWQHVPL